MVPHFCSCPICVHCPHSHKRLLIWLRGDSNSPHWPISLYMSLLSRHLTSSPTFSPLPRPLLCLNHNLLAHYFFSAASPLWHILASFSDLFLFLVLITNDIEYFAYLCVYPSCLPFSVTTLASFSWLHNTTFWQHTLGLGWNCSGWPDPHNHQPRWPSPAGVPSISLNVYHRTRHPFNVKITLNVWNTDINLFLFQRHIWKLWRAYHKDREECLFSHCFFKNQL